MFPFGYGLSYTSFRYRKLDISRQNGNVRVRFTVRNTGRRTGAETAQVYVGQLPTSVPTPPKQLAGFAKVTLDPRGRERVTVSLDRRAFSYFDEGRNTWVTPGGRVPIYVGSSSRDIRLTGSVTVPAGEEAPAIPRGAITGIDDKCVDVAGGSSANGTRIQLWECNGTAAQRWGVTSDGTLEALGKCLDVDGRRDGQRHPHAALRVQQHAARSSGRRGRTAPCATSSPGAASTPRARARPTARA